MELLLSLLSTLGLNSVLLFLIKRYFDRRDGREKRETQRREDLFRRIDTCLETLRLLAERGAVTKSGLMVGLGESDAEVLQTLHDLREAGVRIVTLGQYLRPTLEHCPVAEYITPEKFEWYRQQALRMGFDYCASAPMVRSSYRAQEALEAIGKR